MIGHWQHPPTFNTSVLTGSFVEKSSFQKLVPAGSVAGSSTQSGVEDLRSTQSHGVEPFQDQTSGLQKGCHKRLRHRQKHAPRSRNRISLRKPGQERVHINHLCLKSFPPLPAAPLKAKPATAEASGRLVLKLSLSPAAPVYSSIFSKPHLASDNSHSSSAKQEEDVKTFAAIVAARRYFALPICARTRTPVIFRRPGLRTRISCRLRLSSFGDSAQRRRHFPTIRRLLATTAVATLFNPWATGCPSFQSSTITAARLA